MDPADEIVSLGDHCVGAYALKLLGFKHASYPFDWALSTPDMVAHALRDDFQLFLDMSQVVPNSKP